MEELFLELVQTALGNRTHLSKTPTDKEWKLLYDMANKQALVGVCFAGLECLNKQQQRPQRTLLMNWYGLAEYVKLSNERVNQQCVELQNRLSDAGFRSCVLKGQAIAEYYDEEIRNLRQSGDIDIWLDGNRKLIMEYVNKVSPMDDVRWLHTQLKVFDTTEVEIHFLPSYLECPWYDRALQLFFESEKERCFAVGRCTDRFNQVFILAHAFRHLFSEGVGLRQLMDYYFVLKNSKKRMTREEFVKVMSKTGMLRFAMAIMWLMQEAFGLEEKYLLCEPSEKEGRFLLDEVMQSGNFGCQDERVKHSLGESAVHRFFRIAAYNFRVVRFSPWIVICSPFWRIWHWCWRKQNGYK